MDSVFRVVRNDGRREDDVILLGDFNADYHQITRQMQSARISCAITSAATNVRGTRQFDNIVYQELATDEFTGVAGVYDFLRERNLSLEAALEISDHIPVWAEFSVFEGGQPGRVARNKAAPTVQ
jgi:endonuclease/exonuclease/phosphatase family metal-dependent hydrolase